MCSGYQVPIWRIDDGPVHGIPYEQCQAAAAQSLDAVSKDLPPSWPDLTCANVSYTGPDSTFSHVVSLAEGPHTLWTGLLVMDSMPNVGWVQACLREQVQMHAAQGEWQLVHGARVW